MLLILAAPTASRTKSGWSSACHWRPCYTWFHQHIDPIPSVCMPCPAAGTHCPGNTPCQHPGRVSSTKSTGRVKLATFLGVWFFSTQIPKNCRSPLLTTQRISSILTTKWQKLKTTEWVMAADKTGSVEKKKSHCKFSLKCQRTAWNLLLHCFTLCHKKLRVCKMPTA